jgi:hypothetical protein
MKGEAARSVDGPRVAAFAKEQNYHPKPGLAYKLLHPSCFTIIKWSLHYHFAKVFSHCGLQRRYGGGGVMGGGGRSRGVSEAGKGVQPHPYSVIEPRASHKTPKFIAAARHHDGCHRW